MVNSFADLVAEVQRSLGPVENTADSICSIIQESIKNRHVHGEYPMLSDTNFYFDLMCQMAMIDLKKGTRIDHDDLASKLTSGPKLWFLSEKAIKLHRDLTYEGYYGFEK